MPDYSILTYYINESTVPSNELKTLTGGAQTMQVVIHRLVPQRIIISVHLSGLPIIYYKSDRLDKEENTINWSIIGEENWKDLPLASGFTTYTADGYNQTPRYRKENGRVYLSGALQNLSAIAPINAQSLSFATLPIGFRPTKNKIMRTYLTVGTNNGTVNTSCRLDIIVNGVMRIHNNMNNIQGNVFFLSLDNISFEID